MQVNERTMSLGGDDVLRQTKDFKATQRLERAKAQKRKYEESKKEEEEAQKNAWARLEEEVGEGQEEDADNDDPSFALRPTRKRKEIEPVYIPPNILFHPSVTRAAMRAGIASDAVVDLFSAIVSGLHG